jgi:hypothetical protein
MTNREIAAGLTCRRPLDYDENAGADHQAGKQQNTDYSHKKPRSVCGFVCGYEPIDRGNVMIYKHYF